MSVFQAVIYGIVQGLGEFLPISSSAHLIAVPWLFHWKDPGLSFDVALHLGTLIAVISFFWKEWLQLISAGLTKPRTSNGRLFWFLALASVPGAVLGKLLEEKAESVFRNPALIGIMLIIMGIVLYIADMIGKKRIQLNKISFMQSLWIGISQALAIIPGVSRSGITMSTGLFLGLTRENTARFSFLLSTPIILGAGLLKMKELTHYPVETIPFAIGILTSAITGFLSIKFFLNFLKNKSFTIFVVYRFIFGALLIMLYLK